MIGNLARIELQARGLALAPLVSALAAGCSAIIKPSKMTPATSAMIAQIVAQSFALDSVAVAEDGVETSTQLLALPFDHIFFTGSPAVGKFVMQAAAKTLASVTLELGGKSPVIFGPDADIAQAARWIAWGRFINAGQTPRRAGLCLRPRQPVRGADARAAGADGKDVRSRSRRLAGDGVSFG